MTTWWDDSGVTAKVRDGARAGVIAATEAVLAEGTRLILSPPKSGRIYRRAGRTHQASAAGQAPANDLGFLVASGRAIYPDQEDLFVISGIANWSTEYAVYLELGTARIDPRPYAFPALDFVSPEFSGYVALGIQARLVV
jgi:hypothetical protein